LDNSITNKNKSKKDKSILLIILATFFNQYQSTVIQVDLDYSDILDEDLMEITELLIEFSDKYYE
jgi:hypothetical protein